jgi:hypothetical protein
VRTLPLRLFHLEIGLRWTARVLAVFLVGLVLVFFIGEGEFSRFTLSAVEAILMTFLFSTCIGMALAWRWPLIGGVISVTGILLYYAVDVVMRGGRFLNNVYFDLMLLAGVLFLLSAIIRRRMSAV